MQQKRIHNFTKRHALECSQQHWKPPKCPSTIQWINKLWYSHTMDYDTAMRMNHNTRTLTKMLNEWSQLQEYFQIDPSKPTFGVENNHHSTALFRQLVSLEHFHLDSKHFTCSPSVPIFSWSKMCACSWLGILCESFIVLFPHTLLAFQNSLTIAFQSHKFQKTIGNKIFQQTEIYLQRF